MEKKIDLSLKRVVKVFEYSRRSTLDAILDPKRIKYDESILKVNPTQHLLDSGPGVAGTIVGIIQVGLTRTK